HLVLSTLHTKDAISTPIRLIDMGAPHYMVATSVHAVLAQRLLRLVCESCAEPYKPEGIEARWLASVESGEGPAPRYMHGRGCSNCNGTGFQGRTGVYELLEMTPELVRAANRNDPMQFIETARRQLEGQTLGSNAFRLAMQGRTTVEEAIRVASSEEE
ncbi:MAG TPA: ATPase, T2SS/T4P/T4SS family, partial [Polyangiales bacterium]|nr:ATPase, T2SS/T4P/T4SS family [Polyangiales bacterium]